MTTEQIQKFHRRIDRKCWKQIQAIQQAANMIEVKEALHQAMYDVYDLGDVGVQEAKARKEGTLGQHYARANRRTQLARHYRQEVVLYLIKFIPLRLRESKMYIEILQQLN